MKKLRQLMLTAVIIGAVLTTAAAAESFSVLLQKGIFAEETERNLDTAIKIYQQITAEAATNRPVVAQAQYRLGVCYQKKGSKEQAISVLNDLLRQFPAEAVLGQKARDLLAELGQTPSGNVTIRQLPLTAALVYSVSPDGRLVAYRPKGNANVVIYEIGTGKTWTAVKGNADQIAGVFISPEGRWVAYQLLDLISQSTSLYVARIDGSEAKQVYRSDENSFRFIYAWSADGGHLIVSSETVNSETEKRNSVDALDVKTGTVKEIKRLTGPPALLKACPSSDGRYLACRWGMESEYRSKITVIDLESATESTVIEKGVGDLVGWSPADAGLLFSSDRTGARGLWAIPVRDGKPSGEPELVKANVGDISIHGVTRDGSIYYTEEAKSSVYVYVATANFQTGEVSGPPRRVTDRFPGWQSQPAWSSNGQKLMIAVGGDWKRFVAVSLASGEQKDFPVSDTFTMPLYAYAWSPDEAFLLVQSFNAAGQDGIHRYELASGATERVTAHVAGAMSFHPRFSPDGSSFYYAQRKFSEGPDHRTDWKDCVLRRDLRSGDEELVCESPEKLQIHWPFELSPDGKRLAVVTSDEQWVKDFVVAIKVRGLSGAGTKEVARMAPRENVTSLAWTPDGKRLVYTKALPYTNQGAKGPTEIWATEVDSGQSVELKFSLPWIRDIAIHPDGRQIAFLAGLHGGPDLWVMEGLMPKAQP